MKIRVLIGKGVRGEVKTGSFCYCEEGVLNIVGCTSKVKIY